MILSKSGTNLGSYLPGRSMTQRRSRTSSLLSPDPLTAPHGARQNRPRIVFERVLMAGLVLLSQIKMSFQTSCKRMRVMRYPARRAERVDTPPGVSRNGDAPCRPLQDLWSKKAAH